MKKIPQNRFLEMTDDVYVDTLFPNMQVDVFKYKSSKQIGDGEWFDRIGYLVSTIFMDELYYEYYTGDKFSYDHLDKIVEDLKDHVHYSVIKTL